MAPHPHLSEFNVDDIPKYQNVRIFYLIPGSQGMWQETTSNRRGEFDELLVLVKIRDRLYRYHSPESLHIKMSQLAIADVIRRKLMSSVRFQVATALRQI